MSRVLPSYSVPAIDDDLIVDAIRSKKKPECEKRVKEWLTEREVIPSVMKCTPSAERSHPMTKETNKRYGWRCNESDCVNFHTRKSERESTVFSGSKLCYGWWVLLAFFFLVGESFSTILSKVKGGKKTVTRSLNLFRSVIDFEVGELFEDPEGLVREVTGQIGGDGIIVEVDETKCGKRRYHRGHRVEGVWVVGGIERTPERRFFAIPVKDRSSETLYKILKKFVHPGSILYSDCWAAYNGPAAELFRQHETVNHSRFFLDPLTEVHTNGIEGKWAGLKRFVPKRAYSYERIGKYLNEAIWRHQNRGNLWEAFWEAFKRFGASVVDSVKRHPSTDPVKREKRQREATERTEKFEARKARRVEEKAKAEERKVDHAFQEAAQQLHDEEVEAEKKEARQKKAQEKKVLKVRKRKNLKNWGKADPFPLIPIPEDLLTTLTQRPVLPPPPPPKPVSLPAFTLS